MRVRRLRLPIVAFVAAAAATLVAFVLPGAAASAPPGCNNRTNTTYQTLLQCVTLEGVRAHQAAFQAIANDNDDPFYPGTRAAGTKGYADSVEYVARPTASNAFCSLNTSTSTTPTLLPARRTLAVMTRPVLIAGRR